MCSEVSACTVNNDRVGNPNLGNAQIRELFTRATDKFLSLGRVLLTYGRWVKLTHLDSPLCVGSTVRTNRYDVRNGRLPRWCCRGVVVHHLITSACGAYGFSSCDKCRT